MTAKLPTDPMTPPGLTTALTGKRSQRSAWKRKDPGVRRLIQTAQRQAVRASKNTAKPVVWSSRNGGFTTASSARDVSVRRVRTGYTEVNQKIGFRTSKPLPASSGAAHCESRKKSAIGWISHQVAAKQTAVASSTPVTRRRTDSSPEDRRPAA